MPVEIIFDGIYARDHMDILLFVAEGVPKTLTKRNGNLAFEKEREFVGQFI